MLSVHDFLKSILDYLIFIIIQDHQEQYVDVIQSL